MENTPLNDLTLTADALIGELGRRAGTRCLRCGGPICHHRLLMSFALGFKDAPRCLECFAQLLERDSEELCESLLNYIYYRDCYRSAWIWATKQEGTEQNPVPACFFGSAILNRSLLERSDAGQFNSTNLVFERNLNRFDQPIDSAWDAGDMGCGELVLELRLRMQALRPGDVLKLCARDPGAPEDLPAWCRLTGHHLLRAEHPVYWIQRKE